VITKKADHSAPVNAGSAIGFTVEVENTGTGDATGVVLNDPLPAGSGSGVTWTIDTSTGTPANFVLSGAKGSQKLSLASSTLPAGADYKVHLVSLTSQTECGVYNNTATLTTGNANNPTVAAKESCQRGVVLFCVAVSKVTPKRLVVGRKTKLTIHLTKHGKAVKGVRARIKGPKMRVRTKPSNRKGVIKRLVKMKKKGIVIVSPIARKRCNTKRVRVTKSSRHR
jgi:uncharacterized repeat protein (TIGR01451 family)